MAKIEYEILFSTRRLVKLLTDAGFDVTPPRLYEGGFIRIISVPADREVRLEGAVSYGAEFTRLTRPKHVENVKPGQYL